MEDIVKKAKYLIENGRIEKTSDTMWDVEDNMVRFVTKKGRNFFTCTCDNDSRFCKESPMCCHKFAVIFLMFNNDFKDRLNKLTDEYKKHNTITEELPVNHFIMELEDLGRIR